MATFGKVVRVGVVVALMLVNLATGAQGQAPSGSFGGELRGMMLIRGKVICVGCSLDEVREGQPGEHHFYELAHRQGQMVMKVDWVSEPQRWSYFNQRIWVRGKDSLLQKLTAEENLSEEVEVTAIPKNSTLDIFGVTILEERTKKRGGE